MTPKPECEECKKKEAELIAYARRTGNGCGAICKTCRSILGIAGWKAREMKAEADACARPDK